MSIQMSPAGVAPQSLWAVAGALLATLSGCLSSEATSDDLKDTDAVQQPIINGTVPPTGALQGFGVVSLGSCTGTLVTNRHVLTAHHCVRKYDPTTNPRWAAALAAPGSITATLEAPTMNFQAVNESILEPPGTRNTWTLDAGDYALITLDAPLTVNSSTNLLYNPIYSDTDDSLAGQNVNCMGYGFTTEATGATPAGNSMLTSANMVITSPSGPFFDRFRSGNVVGFGGDSGSTCFLNGHITGVQSTCACTSFIDFNLNGKNDLWGECASAFSCRSSAPSNFRTFVEDAILAPLQITYDALPSLPAGSNAVATVTSPRSSFTLSVLGSVSIPRVTPRSGLVTVVVDQEPDRTMCPRAQLESPMSGTAVVTQRCLGDGLVSALL